MSAKLCIDLCCGRGGFSRAFKEAGWEVVTVDIDPKFEPDICADITDSDTVERLRRFSKFDIRGRYSKIVVLASPPCEMFSLCNGSKRENLWPKPGIGQALRVVAGVMDIIEAVRPDYWVIENPKARLRWFIGNSRHTVRLSDFGAKSKKPTDLWSNFDFGLIEGRRDYCNWAKVPGGGWQGGAGRATMPLGLSQAILEAVSGAEGES